MTKLVTKEHSMPVFSQPPFRSPNGFETNVFEDKIEHNKNHFVDVGDSDDGGLQSVTAPL